MADVMDGNDEAISGSDGAIGGDGGAIDCGACLRESGGMTGAWRAGPSLGQVDGAQSGFGLRVVRPGRLGPAGRGERVEGGAVCHAAKKGGGAEAAAQGRAASGGWRRGGRSGAGMVVPSERRVQQAAARRRTPSRNARKLGDRLRSGSMWGAIFRAHSHFATPEAGQPAFARAAAPPV